MLENKKSFRSYLMFKSILDEKGITAYRVATDLGISPMAFSDWKNGKSKPKMEKMVKIADYLGVPVSTFLETESD